MRHAQPSKLDHAMLTVRRLALAVALVLIGVAGADKLVTILGGRLLDLYYPFGAARLLTFADTFLLLVIALYLWEIRHEIVRARSWLEGVAWRPAPPLEPKPESSSEA
jgi:membrane protein YdbS with pleckstrin-like domain